MNRIEFLNILRKSLEEEMPLEKVEENIKYYDEYISSRGDSLSQEEEIKNIGDPRLIAQTIIDSYKMSKEYQYTGKKATGSNSRRSYSTGYENEHETEAINKTSAGDVFKMIKRGVIIAVILIIVFIILGFAVNIFFRIGIPILLCYLLIRFLIGIFKK